jgi:type II secretory pathway pseudopilin PulG
MNEMEKRVGAVPKKPAGFTIVEMLLVLGLIGIISGTLLIVMNPDLTSKRAKDAAVRATMAKLIKSASYYEAANGEYPLCEEFLEWVEGVEVETSSVNNQCVDENDPNVTFSVAGIELPETCGANMFYGSGSNQCHFHYNGAWSGGEERPHFYVRTWEFEDSYFCWDPEASGDQIRIDTDRTCGTLGGAN